MCLKKRFSYRAVKNPDLSPAHAYSGGMGYQQQLGLRIPARSRSLYSADSWWHSWYLTRNRVPNAFLTTVWVAFLNWVDWCPFHSGTQRVVVSGPLKGAYANPVTVLSL